MILALNVWSTRCKGRVLAEFYIALNGPQTTPTPTPLVREVPQLFVRTCLVEHLALKLGKRVQARPIHLKPHKKLVDSGILWAY